MIFISDIFILFILLIWKHEIHSHLFGYLKKYSSLKLHDFLHMDIPFIFRYVTLFIDNKNWSLFQWYFQLGFRWHIVRLKTQQSCTCQIESWRQVIGWSEKEPLYCFARQSSFLSKPCVPNLEGFGEKFYSKVQDLGWVQGLYSFNLASGDLMKFCGFFNVAPCGLLMSFSSSSKLQWRMLTFSIFRGF